MGAGIRLHDIRAHEGSQARAWEELAYQVRPPVGEGHVETRKTRAPDAGVEWYEVYEDGHQEGFQAKFHATLSDALGGMRESVKAVCTKRPTLTALTFVVPYDFTDSGTGSTKSDQDRWEEAVVRWRKDFSAASGITFKTIRAGDIIAELTRKEHAGRREFWFGDLEISDEWLQSRFAESLQVAGGRYTPEADSPTAIDSILDAVAAGPTFFAELKSLAQSAIAAATQDSGMWGAEKPSAEELIADLRAASAATFGNIDSGGDLLPGALPDLQDVATPTVKLLDLAVIESQHAPSHDRRTIDAAISALQALQTLVASDRATSLTNRALALYGTAGQGKTHALMRSVQGCLLRGAPALAILGQRLSDKNWWPAIAETLDGVDVSSDVFLQALDSLAEARQCRALLVIDAINESQRPGRWRDELPAMLTQIHKYPHIALVISLRTDYRDTVGVPETLLQVRHPGFTGREAEALVSYCTLFDIPVPAQALHEPALSSPLFLRMYCEVIAADPLRRGDPPTRSILFERYASVLSAKVTSRLDLPPTSTVVGTAMTEVADRILRQRGAAIAREEAERAVDALLPGRTFPETLFQQMVSGGLIELRPTYDGSESVAFPFQAYSEHLLARRLLASIERESRSWLQRVIPLPYDSKRRRLLSKRIATAPWSWRPLAVALPELEGLELVDILPTKANDSRLSYAMRSSLTDREASAFGPRALELLQHFLAAEPSADEDLVDVILTLAPRVGHPANSDWLHASLASLAMPERDATWSIATFRADEESDAFHRLTRWAERLAGTAHDEEARLAAIALMWLLTSPNRFLRDRASKALVSLLARNLNAAAVLVAKARDSDDPYVQERTLTCTYGAALVGGDADPVGARTVLDAIARWAAAGLPVDVIARDSARGIAAWGSDRRLLRGNNLALFVPPYGASPPDEPPTREDLESAYGPLKDAAGNYVDWRASSILHSCLDWHGDFNKYVVKGDVDFFSRHPIDGPAPTANVQGNPMDEIDADWAGRWIAHRAISLGWTEERFGEFESAHDLRRGREGHKAERFGKKYQWIAHRELLARLADNVHPAYQNWSTNQLTYQGPWVWYGRDFDPTLPPSTVVGELQVCQVARDRTARWATIDAPDMDAAATPDEWVAKTNDLPSAASMFNCCDPDGSRWLAIYRYATWDRENARRTGITKRERDAFFLQFSWLVQRGQGSDLYAYIKANGLAGRRMPERSRERHQYLGETRWAPIVATAQDVLDDYDIPEQLLRVGIRPRPAVEHYVWEGSSLDCSIDESVNFYSPTPELLGDADWVGHRSEWRAGGKVIARAIEVPGADGIQEVLLVDSAWLDTRLRDLDADLVVGTLSERHALPLTDDDYRSMAYSDIWYVSLVSPTDGHQETGPQLRLRRRTEQPMEAPARSEGTVPDEPFDPTSI